MTFQCFDGALAVYIKQTYAVNFITEEFNTAVEWLANKTVDPMPLLSAEFPQGDLLEAMEFALDKSKASKVQLVF